MALARYNRSNVSPMQSWDLGTFGNAFNDFDRLFAQMASPFFGQSGTTGWSGWSGHPVDLYETDEHIVLEMAVPGIRVDDLDISIEGRQLTIHGTLPHFEEEEKRRYWLQNIPRGEFTRTVTLPVAVEVDTIQANVHDGLLVLTMPKVAQARARKIQIGSGQQS